MRVLPRYLLDVWDHLRAFVLAGGIALLAAYLVNVMGATISPWAYFIVFVVLGLHAAAFYAWEEQYAEATRLQREAERMPGPKLAIQFEPGDTRYTTFHSGDEWTHVGIRNDGERRATHVRLTLQDVEPPVPKSLGKGFLFNRSEEFDINPTGGGPPNLVPVLSQRQVHNPPGYHRTIHTRRPGVLQPTSRLRMVLRLSAAEGTAEPLALEF